MAYQGSITLTDLTDGINNAVVYLYMRQVGDTAPTRADNPTGTLTYNFSNGSVTEKTSGALNGWVSNLSNIANTDNPIYFISAIANSSSATLQDDILPGEWTAPILLAKSGGNGQPGNDGLDGFNQATVHLYQRAANTPPKPGNSLTYTFADGSITAAGGIDNNWQISIPTASANGYPCYVISASAISRNATVQLETENWTSPVKLAENGLNGAPGINTATVYLYQRAVETPNPSKPAVSLKYTFADATLSEGSLGNWKQSISELSGTNPIWAITAVASSNSSYDYIDPSDWTAPVILAENGETGAKGLNQATVFLYQRASSNPGKPANTTDYNFETGKFTLPSGWFATIPTGTNPCWVTTGVAIGNTTYGTLKWVAPSILVENGQNGQSPTVTPTGSGVEITDPTTGISYTVYNGTNGTSYFTHIRYSVSSTPTQESDVSSLPNGKTYVGIQTTTNSNAPAWNDSNWHWNKFVGDNGAPGINGLSVSSLRELHYLKTLTGGAPSQITSETASQIVSTDSKNVWTSVIPTYETEATYYICTETTLSNNSKVWSAPIEDKASTESNRNALNAQLIANATKQHFWNLTEQYINPSGVTYPAGTYITSIPVDDEGGISGFKTLARGGNILMQSGGIYFRDGLTTLSEFTPTALKFYNLGSSSPRTVSAQVDSNGLYVMEGGVVGGTNTAGNNGYIYLSTKNYGSNLSVAGTTKSNWRAVIGTNFGVDSEGNLYAISANLTGTITANNGTIGRFNITPSALYTGNSDSTTAGMGADAYAFWAGATNAANAKFKVSYDGALTASNADIKGHITATSGTIGNCEIVDGNLQITGYVTEDELTNGLNGKANNDETYHRTQRIYYRQTASGAKPSKNTTWLSSSGTGYGNWSTSIPKMTNGSGTKYPKLYTCVQGQTIAQFNGGTGTICDCSDVLLDESTTVIDGGNIITGSIEANKISVLDLSAIKADIGDITAGNITKGNNSINFDNSPATLEFKNASTWSSATQGIRFNSSGLAVKGAITATSLTLSADAKSNLESSLTIGELGTDSGFNVKIDTTNGILFRNGTTKLSKVDTNGMIVYDGGGDGTGNQLAVFGKGSSPVSEELEISDSGTLSSGSYTWSTNTSYSISSVTSVEISYSASDTTDSDDENSLTGEFIMTSSGTNVSDDNGFIAKYTYSGTSVTVTITPSASNYEPVIESATMSYQMSNNIGSILLGSNPSVTNTTKYPLVVGCGASSSAQRNALRLDASGTMKLQGNLYLLGHASAIGTFLNRYKTSNTSLTAQKWSTVLSCTNSTTGKSNSKISAGVWLGYITITFSAAATGTVRVAWGTKSSTTDRLVQVPATSGSGYLTKIRVPVRLSLSKTTSYYIRAWSYYACSVTAAYLSLVRIR